MVRSVQALYEKIYESYDFTRKFELSRWYVDIRRKFAENPEIRPPGQPPGPISTDGTPLAAPEQTTEAGSSRIADT